MNRHSSRRNNSRNHAGTRPRASFLELLSPCAILGFSSIRRCAVCRHASRVRTLQRWDGRARLDVSVEGAVARAILCRVTRNGCPPWRMHGGGTRSHVYEGRCDVAFASEGPYKALRSCESALSELDAASVAADNGVTRSSFAAGDRPVSPQSWRVATWSCSGAVFAI